MPEVSAECPLRPDFTNHNSVSVTEGKNREAIKPPGIGKSITTVSQTDKVMFSAQEPETATIYFSPAENVLQDECRLLHAGEEGMDIKPPAFKLKGWRGWLLGAGTLLAGTTIGAHLYGRAMNFRGNKHLDNAPEPQGAGKALMPTLNDEILSRSPVSAMRAEKLQIYKSNDTYQVKKYSGEALLDIKKLNDFDRLDKDPSLPRSLCLLKQSGQLDRAFHQRYLYPLIVDAEAGLRRKSLPVKGKHLMVELVALISSMIQRFEELNIAHALRIDAFYNQLVLLNREISIEERIANPSARSKQLVNAKWIMNKFKEAVTNSQLEELRRECITLLKYYSNTQKLDINFAISEKQRSIMNKIDASFDQLFEKLTNKGIDKYITNYLSGWMFNLDREVSEIVKRDAPTPKIYRLFPEIGPKLFKDKRAEYRKPASLLIAYKIFIPRLMELIDLSLPYIDRREHRLLEMVLCSFFRPEDLLYCGHDETNAGQGRIYDEVSYGWKGKITGAQPANKETFKANEKNKETKDEIEAYLEKPVPFNGHMGSVIIGSITGTATGAAAGLGGAVASYALDMGKGTVPEGGWRIDSEIRFDSSRTSNADSDRAGETPSTGSEKPEQPDSHLRNRKINKDLEKFPDIPLPATEKRDYMMIWNDAAREQLKGKDYIVTRGITENVSGDVPDYIKQTQKLLQHHFSRVINLVNTLRQTLHAKAEDAEYHAYLKNYFREALSIDDEKILTMAITRFKQVVNSMDDFLQQTRLQNYNNIFIMSTRRQETADKGQSASLLSDTELEEVPVALTSYSDKSSIAVIADHSMQDNPMFRDLCRRTLGLDLTETLTHEAAHGAIGAGDYLYLPRTETGQALSAQDAFKFIRSALTNTILENDLVKAINEFCVLNVIKNPLESYQAGEYVTPELASKIMAFLNAFPAFRSYLLMNNAEHLQIFIRDLALAAEINTASHR